MAKSSARLRIVGDADAPTLHSSEVELQQLFALEAQLAGLQADVRLALEGAREHYRGAHDLLVKPRMELLRQRYAPKPQRRPQ